MRSRPENIRVFRTIRPIRLALILLCPLLCPAAAAADEPETAKEAPSSPFFYGIALGLGQEIYADVDEEANLLPIIGYRGDKLSVFGPFVTYEMLGEEKLTLELRLSPRFDGYEESDSDVFTGMDERKASFDAGFGLGWEIDAWELELSGLRDVLDRSDGQEWSLSLGRGFRGGPFLIEPNIGLSYLDSRHVDYYYGVEADEATASRPAYAADSAVNTSLGVKLTTPALLGGITRIVIENTWYDSSIDDSPLTDEDSAFSIFFTFWKFFGS